MPPRHTRLCVNLKMQRLTWYWKPGLETKKGWVNPGGLSDIKLLFTNVSWVLCKNHRSGLKCSSTATQQRKGVFMGTSVTFHDFHPRYNMQAGAEALQDLQTQAKARKLACVKIG